jgi:hypothetical protein
MAGYWEKNTDLYGDESFHHGHHCERYYVEHEGRGGQYVEPGEIWSHIQEFFKEDLQVVLHALGQTPVVVQSPITR